MESTRITESIRKAQNTANDIALYKQGFVIVPYQPSGFQDYTNRGYSDEPINPDDFETFKRLWTGNDAFTISWKGSITFGDGENDEKIVSFSLGDVFVGNLEINDSDVQISQDESFSAYKSQQSKDKLTFRVSSYFNITDYYKLMFYKFPEISKSTLYRMSSLEKDYVGRELVGYVITFESLNQDLANTGRARQQNVMPNAPGQGYLECVVHDKDWPSTMTKEEWEQLRDGIDYYTFYDRYITSDFQKTLNNPPPKVVIKQFGVSVPSTVAFMGRPAGTGTRFQVFKSPRLLFPINLNNASTPNLFNTQQNETNFYALEFTPTIEYWKDWKENIKDTFLGANNQWKFYGFLKYDHELAQKSNPSDGGTYKYDIFGYIEKTPSTVLQIPWECEMPAKDVGTQNVYGCSSKYSIGGKKVIHDHMFDNFWTQKDMKSLPINIKNTFGFGFSLSSMALGKMSWAFQALELFVIGVSYLSSRFLNKMDFETFRGIISAPLLDLNNDVWKSTVGGDGGNKVEMGLFDGSKDNPSALFFNGATLNTGFEAKMTDLFTDDRYPNKIFSTLNIGQTKFENGEWINEDHEPYRLNGHTKLIQSSYGYIIDRIIICSVGKVDISVEFLDENDNIIWTGIYQSEAKWTDSLREIWTERNTSVYNRENMFFDKPIPYPEKLPPLIGELPELPMLNVAANVFAKYHYNSTGGDQNFNWLVSQGFMKLEGNVYSINQPNPDTILKYKICPKTEFIPDIERLKYYYPNIEIGISAYCDYKNLWYTGNIISYRYDDFSKSIALGNFTIKNFGEQQQEITLGYKWEEKENGYAEIFAVRHCNSVGNSIQTIKCWITLENDEFYLNMNIKALTEHVVGKSAGINTWSWIDIGSTYMWDRGNPRVAPSGVISKGNTLAIRMMPRLP